MYPLALSLLPELITTSESSASTDPTLSLAGIKPTTRALDVLPLGTVTQSLLNKADLHLGGFYNTKKKHLESVNRDIPASGPLLQRPYAGDHLGLQTKGTFFKGPPKDITSAVFFKPSDFVSELKAEQVVGLVHVEPFTPELAQSHQVPELTFLKDQKLALAPNTVDSWESIARSTVQILSKVEIMANAAIVLLDKHIIANNPLNSPQEDLTSLRTLVGQAYGTLTNGQACAVTQLSNVILHRRDAWLSNMGDQTAKQLRIAPLFGPTLFPSNVINKTRQEYIQDNKMS